MTARLNRPVLVAFTILLALAGARTGHAQRATARPAGRAKAATVQAPQGEPVAGISC